MMTRLRTILCPVDFSHASSRALEQAAALARWSGARLHVLHAWHAVLPPVVPSMGGGWPVTTSAASADDLAAIRADVSLFCSKFADAGLDLAIEVRDGEAASAIVDAAADLPADLIVIGTHGHGPIERFLIGSVTTRVLHRAGCPVLTIPSHVATPSCDTFSTIVCGVDFSPASIAALGVAESLAAPGRGELVLTHVVEWPVEPAVAGEIAPEFRALRGEEAATRLGALVTDELRASCRPVTVIRQGRPWRELLAVASERSADLLVLGLHGHGIVERLFVGSTANHVVRSAACPVLTVRAD